MEPIMEEGEMAASGVRRLTWREKFEKEMEPRIVEDRRGGGRMLLSTPREIDAVVRKVKKGKVVTVKQIMDKLAIDHHADRTCPMTTGIFLRIVSEVAEEDLLRGKRRVTPYWRVLKGGGELNPKYPGGVENQRARLEEEGHTIERGQGGKPPRVKEYSEVLQKL